MTYANDATIQNKLIFVIVNVFKFFKGIAVILEVEVTLINS
jgi:hypothetical protein